MTFKTLDLRGLSQEDFDGDYGGFGGTLKGRDSHVIYYLQIKLRMKSRPILIFILLMVICDVGANLLKLPIMQCPVGTRLSRKVSFEELTTNKLNIAKGNNIFTSSFKSLIALITNGIFLCSGFTKCNVDNTLEDAVNWIGETSGTDSENRQKLIDYLVEEYPQDTLEFPTKSDDWLINEVYITQIIKEQEDDPDKVQVQQTPSNYLRSLVYQLQGLDTAGLSDLEVVQHYCR